MPRLIQSNPVGLLDVLTSKDGGTGPAALLDEVRATVNLEGYYLRQFRRSRTRTLTKAVINTSTTGPEGWNYFSLLAGATAADLAVPSGQMWHVFGVELHVTTVVGTVNVQAGFTVTDPNVAAHGYGIPIGNATGAVAAGTQGVSGGPCDLWALPGGGAAFFIRDWLLATNDCDVLMSVDYEVVAF